MSDGKRTVTATFAPGAELPAYTDMQAIDFGPSGFTIDFAQTVPGLGTAVIKCRVIMVPPSQFKDFIACCQTALGKYEAAHGAVASPSPPLGVIFQDKSKA